MWLDFTLLKTPILLPWLVFAGVANDDEEAGGVEGVFRLIGLGEKTRWKVADDSQQRLSLTSLWFLGSFI